MWWIVTDRNVQYLWIKRAVSTTKRFCNLLRPLNSCNATQLPNKFIRLKAAKPEMRDYLNRPNRFTILFHHPCVGQHKILECGAKVKEKKFHRLGFLISDTGRIVTVLNGFLFAVNEVDGLFHCAIGTISLLWLWSFTFGI